MELITGKMFSSFKWVSNKSSLRFIKRCKRFKCSFCQHSKKTCMMRQFTVGFRFNEIIKQFLRLSSSHKKKRKKESKKTGGCLWASVLITFPISFLWLSLSHHRKLAHSKVFLLVFIEFYFGCSLQKSFIVVWKFSSSFTKQAKWACQTFYVSIRISLVTDQQNSIFSIVFFDFPEEETGALYSLPTKVHAFY